MESEKNKNLKVGDRVRLLKAKGEGPIGRFLPDGRLEVNVDEDFPLLVSPSEVVKIDAHEEKVFGRGKTKAGFSARDRLQEQNQAPQAAESAATESPGHATEAAAPESPLKLEERPSLGFVRGGEGQVMLYLLNPSGYEVFLTCHLPSEKGHKTLAALEVPPGKAQLVANFSTKNHPEWQSLDLQLVFFSRQRPFQALPPLDYRLKTRVQSFYNSASTLPILEQKGAHYNLPHPLKQQQAPPPSPDPGALQEALSEAAESKPNYQKEAMPEVFDLHIEQLVDHPQALSPDQILELQQKTFEQVFEKCLAAESRKITFIHGVGRGKLKALLHRYLSYQKEQIAWYREARPERFGYGATEVCFWE